MDTTLRGRRILSATISLLSLLLLLSNLDTSGRLQVPSLLSAKRRLRVLSFTTNLTKASTLISTAAHFGINVEWLQLPENAGVTPETMCGTKLSLVRAAAPSFLPDDVILFVDAYDTVIAASSRHMLDVFDSFKAGDRLVLSSEINCWPERFNSSYPAAEKLFLNSGVYMGTSTSVLNFLDALPWDALDKECATRGKGDQQYFHALYLAQPDLFLLDRLSRLSISMYGVPRSAIAVQGGRLINVVTGIETSLVHFNGVEQKEVVVPALGKLVLQSRKDNEELLQLNETDMKEFILPFYQGICTWKSCRRATKQELRTKWGVDNSATKALLPSSSSSSAPFRASEIPDFLTEAYKAQTAILNLEQRVWIASVIARHATLTKGSTNLLVWGCGVDTAIWFAANAESNSKNLNRTLVVENDKSWIDNVTSVRPDLAKSIVFFNDYKSSVAKYKDYVANPDPEGFRSRLPKRVSEVCWDVVLVDAPPGWAQHQPGRHEVISWVAHQARRCLEQGRSTNEIVVFVHDVERPAEGEASRKFLTEGGGAKEIGRIRATMGDLVGYIFQTSLGPTMYRNPL